MKLSRSLILVPLLTAVLAGCTSTHTPSGVSSQVTDLPADAATATDAAGAAGEDADVAPETVAAVNTADLPGWFPADLPMPAGSYRWTTVDDAGAFLQFGISGEPVIDDLVARLAAAGYAVTAVDDHGEGWKTWFTESETYRVNIAARDLGSAAAYIDYRIEPK